MLLLSLLNQYKKYLISLLVVLAVGLGGYLYGKKAGSGQTSTTEKIVEKIVTVEVEKSKEHKEKQTKTIKKPDGTIETTITETTDKATEISTQSDKTLTSEKTQTKQNKKNYSLGVFTEIDRLVLDYTKNNLSYGISGGYRLIGDVWANANYNLDKKDTSVGVSFEF